MADPDAFDEFYKNARNRILVQALALTGDLTAARGGVRHAFVIAWHHWRKVSALEDPEAYVRPLAWNHALRRAQARLFHRNKGLDPELSATLEALVKLPVQQRRVLLLNQLTALSIPALAREAGLPQTLAEQELQSATAQFALHRNAPSTALPVLLSPLDSVAGDVRWPRGSILRRAGSARRRGHTIIGVAAAVVATTASGVLVSTGADERPTITHEEITPQAQAIQVVEPPAPKPRLVPGRMLATTQVQRLDPRAEWSSPRTHVNTAGDGLVVACQRDRFADPAGVGALVREFTSTPPRRRLPVTSATQFSELSGDEEAASAAYRSTLGWFANCATPNTYLAATETLAGVGNEAMMFHLQQWGASPQRITVAVARSGQVTTTVQVTRAGTQEVRPRLTAALLAAAVNAQCGEAGTDTCAAPPAAEAAGPLPLIDDPGMLAEWDLPQPGVVQIGWVGTRPAAARLNLAASRCDETNFSARPFRSSLTRTYVTPGAAVPQEFGLTETIGVTAGERAAIEQAALMIGALTKCEKDELGTKVRRIVFEEDATSQLAVWNLQTEISDAESITFLLAVLRDGNRIGELGFVPAAGAGWTDEQFVAVARRALDRLAEAPRKKLAPEGE